MSTVSPPSQRQAADNYVIVHAKHPLRWIAGIIVVGLFVMLVISAITNPRFRWDIVALYFRDETIFNGIILTLGLTVVSMLVGIVLGVVLAVMRLSVNPVVRGAAGAYVYFFRGTPVLVQLLMWYGLSSLYPDITFGIPGVHLDANVLITPLLAAILGDLGLSPQGYLLVSAHREENVDYPERLGALLDCLEAVHTSTGLPVLVSTHPRTRKRLESLGRELLGGLIFHKPLGFIDYVRLQQDAYCVLSDSGTISEESSILGFPAITLRDSIERPEALDTGSIMMTGLDATAAKCCSRSRVIPTSAAFPSWSSRARRSPCPSAGCSTSSRPSTPPSWACASTRATASRHWRRPAPPSTSSPTGW